MPKAITTSVFLIGYRLDSRDYTIITISALKEDVFVKQERLLQKSFEHNSGFSKIR